MDVYNIHEVRQHQDSNTCDAHKLTLNFTDKTDLSRGDKRVALSGLSIYYTWKNIKNSLPEIRNVKYQEQNGLKNLNFLMDLTVCQTFKIILNT